MKVPQARRSPGEGTPPGPDQSAHSSVTSTPEPKGTSDELATPGQMTLDDLPPAARRTDKGTVWEAARHMTGGLRGRKIRRVVEVVARAGTRGTICHDVALALGADRGNTARRLTDAHRRGLIRDAGTRKAPSGRSQTVWVITASGLTEAARGVAEAS